MEETKGKLVVVVVVGGQCLPAEQVKPVLLSSFTVTSLLLIQQWLGPNVKKNKQDKQIPPCQHCTPQRKYSAIKAIEIPTYCWIWWKTSTGDIHRETESRQPEGKTLPTSYRWCTVSFKLDLRHWIDSVYRPLITSPLSYKSRNIKSHPTH